MKAVVMQGPQQLEVKEVPVPIPESSEVVIRVRACAICGSDLTVYKIGVPDRILGHEMSGEIVATGVAVKGWQKGDRVVVEPSLVCGECHWCRSGQHNLCDSLQYTGLATDGGLAEYARVPAYQLHRLPAEVDYLQGALIEPLAVALRGVRLSALQAGESAVVLGCGAIGLFSLLWARCLGAAPVIAADIVPARLEAARRLADHTVNNAAGDTTEDILELTQGLGAQVILECSGSGEAQLQAIQAARKGGRIVLLGIGYTAPEVALAQLTLKEISLKGSLGYSSLNGKGEFPDCLESVRSGRLDPVMIQPFRCGLTEAPAAFESLLRGELTKAVVIP